MAQVAGEDPVALAAQVAGGEAFAGAPAEGGGEVGRAQEQAGGREAEELLEEGAEVGHTGGTVRGDVGRAAQSDLEVSVLCLSSESLAGSSSPALG